jgi:hypothetical protein
MYTKIGKKDPVATDYPLKEGQKRVATIPEVNLGWINTYSFFYGSNVSR